MKTKHGRLAGDVLGDEGGATGHVVLAHGIGPGQGLGTYPLLCITLVFKARIHSKLSSLRCWQGEFLSSFRDRSPCADVTLLTAITIDDDTDPLQGLVGTYGTELLAHQRRGVETVVTPKDPVLCLLYHHLRSFPGSIFGSFWSLVFRLHRNFDDLFMFWR